MNKRKIASIGSVISIIAALSFTSSAWGLGGIVVSAKTGKPIQNAGVTLNHPGLGPDAITVFTDASGKFLFPEDVRVTAKDAYLNLAKVGYEFSPLGEIHLSDQDLARTDLKLNASVVNNIAKDVPASYWMSDVEESSAKHIANLQCSGCHQLPSPKMLHYGELIEAEKGPNSDAAALEKWKEMVRKESWRAAIKFMKAKAYDIYPDGSEVQMDAVPWDVIQGETYTLFNKRQSEIIANFFAQNFPRDMSYVSPDAYSWNAPAGDLAKVVIKEYSVPKTSMVREAIMVRDSPYIWGADIQKNQVIRIDPVTGEQKNLPVPYKGATGPHTLVGDKNGKLWVSMIDNSQMGMFDPLTSKWKLWTLAPQNMEAKKVFGGSAMVHDIAFDSDGELELDASGSMWVTLIGINNMGSLNPKSGRVEFFPAPKVEGHSPVSTSLYGTMLSSDGKCAWFSQLNGYFGCFNTETHESESLVKFPEGAAPRRMARDRNDMIWLPLYGSGQLVKYDGKSRKLLATYDLPDRRAAPYAVAWDQWRKCVWVTTSNSDVIYRFDPTTETFTVYPFPRRGGYLRQLSVNPNNGVLVGSYGEIPAGSGPSMVVMIEIQDKK